MAAEQFSALAYQKIPAFEMPNGEVLYVEYNKESDTLDVGQPTNAGLVAQHRFPYDHNIGLDANLQAVNEKLNELEEYRAEQQQQKRQRYAPVRMERKRCGTGWLRIFFAVYFPNKPSIIDCKLDTSPFT